MVHVPSESDREEYRYEAWLEKHGYECECGTLLGSEDEMHEHNYFDEGTTCPHVEVDEEPNDEGEEA